MAKHKTLTPEEFQEKFDPKGKIEFSLESPFNSISISPEKTLFIARHWDQLLATTKPLDKTNTTGTAYICRVGNPPCKFDFDVLSFRLDRAGIPMILHVYTEYHHTNEIPEFIKEQMPDNIKEKIKK